MGRDPLDAGATDFGGEALLLAAQKLEHEAWLDVVRELRERGVDDLGDEDLRLHDAITRWGEELAFLRLADPDPTHRVEARRARRAAWEAGAES